MENITFTITEDHITLSKHLQFTSGDLANEALHNIESLIWAPYGGDQENVFERMRMILMKSEDEISDKELIQLHNETILIVQEVLNQGLLCNLVVMFRDTQLK
jgi:hypothetical protein